MATILDTAPTEYPVTLNEAKSHLRVDGNDSDGDITALIDQATKYVESVTGRALVTQTWKVVLDSLPTELKLPKPPLQSVSSISYQDANNATQTLGASNYTVDTNSQPGRVVQSYSGTYPNTYPDLNAVTITFVCGYGARTAVPETYKQAIKLYIEKMYDMPSGPYGQALDDTLTALVINNRIENVSL